MWNEKHRLYPYQEEAVEKMTEANILLAYDMGVGKTPTAIAAIERLRDRGEIIETGTVVVPASLKFQWAREVSKFSDQKAIVIDGAPSTRQQQYIAVRNTSPGYMIMSYDNLLRDWNLHKELGEAFIILDEATAIKSWKANRTAHLKKYRRRWPIRYCLTGTPIENGKAEELFSILEFVEPSLLGNFWEFDRRYVIRNNAQWIEGYKNLDELHHRIKRNTLRRSHRDPEVAKHLPKVIKPDPIRVHLNDGRTRKLVDYISDDILTDLDELAEKAAGQFTGKQLPSLSDEIHGPLMAKIQALRMLLDTPEALRHSGHEYQRGNGDGSQYAYDLMHHKMFNIRATPKLDAVNQYLKDFFDTDPRFKAVIFTSFVTAARYIAGSWNDSSVLFTGSMTSKQRDRVKQTFTNDPDCRLFVSTDAGGYGLDLPVANLLINYDQPWQAGLLAQRNARIRRASSTWGHVTVQDFVVANTIEERMVDLLQHKIAVSEAIIDGQGIDKDGRLDKSDLETLRRFLIDRDDTDWSQEYAS